MSVGMPTVRFTSSAWMCNPWRLERAGRLPPGLLSDLSTAKYLACSTFTAHTATTNVTMTPMNMP